MEAYSMDLRRRVIKACDEKAGTLAAIAKRFSVSVSWITKLKRRRRQTGSIAAKPHGGGRRPALDEAGCERLREWVAEDSDATLAQLCDRIGVAVSGSAMDRTLRRLGLTYKKRRVAPLSKTGPRSSGIAITS
jgi:transposase